SGRARGVRPAGVLLPRRLGLRGVCEERRAMHAEQRAIGERDARADMRVQRANDALELDRGPGRIEQAVVRSDLLGIGHALLRLLGEWRSLVQRAQDQLS